ncbi:MAG: response regulator [Gammaproteobacteria bacterium]|nr:response regulator [Gammaproteobacteria bacterium]
MERATVLVIDDDPVSLASLGKVLTPHYVLRAANSGSRALEIVDSSPRPDLILLDVMMEGVDGYAVLAHLQQQPGTVEIPVIFVTAKESTEDEEKGLQRGAVDYITKPFNPALVLARIRTHLTLKRARDFLHDQNNFLEMEVARRMEENLTIQNVSIRALAHQAETRDPETGGTTRQDRCRRTAPAGDHQRHPRPVQDRGRQDGGRIHRLPPRRSFRLRHVRIAQRGVAERPSHPC